MHRLVTKTKLLNNHKKSYKLQITCFALICSKYYINNKT